MSWKDGVQGILAIAQVIIGVYLMYLILVHTEATEFMWFYFVVYLVLAFIVAGSVSALKSSQIKEEAEKAVSKALRDRRWP